MILLTMADKVGARLRLTNFIELDNVWLCAHLAQEGLGGLAIGTV